MLRNVGAVSIRKWNGCKRNCPIDEGLYYPRAPQRPPNTQGLYDSRRFFFSFNTYFYLARYGTFSYKQIFIGTIYQTILPNILKLCVLWMYDPLSDYPQNICNMASRLATFLRLSSDNHLWITLCNDAIAGRP